MTKSESQAPSSAADVSESVKSTRGPKAERSAAMRARIMEATVDCLNDAGFAATTTQRILESGGISRGALLHHFPTRADLMIAVAEYCVRQQNTYVARRLAPVEDLIAKFLGLTEAAWEATQSRSGVAFIEIMLGGRREPGLDHRLSSLILEREEIQRRDVWRLGEDLGMRGLERDVEVMSRLHTAAMRGLVLERLCSPREDGIDACVELLGEYKRYITGRFLVGDALRAAAANDEQPIG